MYRYTFGLKCAMIYSSGQLSTKSPYGKDGHYRYDLGQWAQILQALHFHWLAAIIIMRSEWPVEHKRDHTLSTLNLLWIWAIPTTNLDYINMMEFVICTGSVLLSQWHTWGMITWMSHQSTTVDMCPREGMMTSSYGNIFRVTGPLWGESIGHRWIPHTKLVTWSFDVLFNLRLNKWLSKQSRRRIFEMLSRSLWRHYSGTSTLYKASVPLSSGANSIHNRMCVTFANIKGTSVGLVQHAGWLVIPLYSLYWSRVDYILMVRQTRVKHITLVTFFNIFLTQRKRSTIKRGVVSIYYLYIRRHYDVIWLLEPAICSVYC